MQFVLEVAILKYSFLEHNQRILGVKNGNSINHSVSYKIFLHWLEFFIQRQSSSSPIGQGLVIAAAEQNAH
jgi:hypothetical protein